MELFNKFDSICEIITFKKEEIKPTSTYSFLRLLNTLAFIITGSVDIQVDSSHYTLSDYDVLYIPKNSYVNIKLLQEKDIKIVTLNFNDEYLQGIQYMAPHKSALAIQNAQFYTAVIYPKIYDLEKSENESNFKSVLKNFIKVNAEYATKFPKQIIVPYKDKLIKRVIELLNNNLKKKFDLASIAKHVNYSGPYISSYFLNYMHINLFDYYSLKKMAYADDLLIKKVKPIDVSKFLGYKTYSTFYRAYKQVFNSKPINSNKLNNNKLNLNFREIECKED